MKLTHVMSHVGVRPRVFGGFALVLSFLILLAGFSMVRTQRVMPGAVEEMAAAVTFKLLGSREVVMFVTQTSSGIA